VLKAYAVDIKLECGDQHGGSA